MGPKKACEKNRGEIRKRMLTIEVKKQIIEKHESGVRVMDLAKIYDRSTSTICTILKQKDAIKSANPAKGTKILSQLRTGIHDEMEKLLLVWMKDKELAGENVTQIVICEKARSIYDDLKKKEALTSGEEVKENTFKASHGWFDNFAKRTGIRFVDRHGDAMGGNLKVDDEYISLFEPQIEVIVSVGKTMVLEADEDNDVNKLKEEQEDKVSTEELVEDTKLHQTISTEEENVISTPTSEIEEMLAIWERLSAFIEKNHPDKASTGRASANFNDTCMTRFRNILKNRQRQNTLDRLLFKKCVNKSAERESKKVKTSDK